MTFMSQTIAEKTQPGQRQSIEESSKCLFFILDKIGLVRLS